MHISHVRTVLKQSLVIKNFTGILQQLLELLHEDVHASDTFRLLPISVHK